jgi:hypothetical protein
MAPVLEELSFQHCFSWYDPIDFWTKNQDRDQGTVQLKDSICFKLVLIGS